SLFFLYFSAPPRDPPSFPTRRSSDLLDANGSLVYATRLGGSLLDSSYGTGIAVDGEGHAYVTGVAITSDFPTTPGAYRTTACPNVYPFAGDGFVAELSVDGSALVYSTLLCGQGVDVPA